MIQEIRQQLMAWRFGHQVIAAAVLLASLRSNHVMSQLGHHWLSNGLVPIRHQAITLTNADLSSIGSFDETVV